MNSDSSVVTSVTKGAVDIGGGCLLWIRDSPCSSVHQSRSSGVVSPRKIEGLHGRESIVAVCARAI